MSLKHISAFRDALGILFRKYWRGISIIYTRKILQSAMLSSDDSSTKIYTSGNIVLSPISVVFKQASICFFVMNTMTMLYFSAPMTLIGVIMSIVRYRGEKKKYFAAQELRLEKYDAYLDEQIEKIEYCVKEQRRILTEDSPSVQQCVRLAEGPDRKLWDRRVQDEDFLSLRLGAGNVPASITIKHAKKMLSLEEDTLADRPTQIAEKYTLLSTTDRGDSSLSEIKDIDGNIVGKSYSVAHDGYVSVACEQFVESSTINELHYYGYYNGEFIEVETEIRGITAGDTLNEVLEMIGVNPEGARVLSELGRSIIIGDERLLEGGYGWIECTDETTSVDGVTGVMIYISMDNVQCQLDFIYGRLAILSCYSY